MAALSCNISFLLDSFQLNFHFFVAATSFSLGFCLIPLWQLFHAIFHSFWLVFTGPVRWTGKQTKIELNPTAKDRTTGCSCTNFEFFQLPVVRFVKKLKNQTKPVYTGCNQSFVTSCVGPYSRTFFPNCWFLNHKKQSRIGWLIPPWQLFHAIFHSIWQVFHWNFHFFR